MAEKRARRTRAELREIMLAAGKEVLFEIEPTLGFEALTYTAVFEHLLATSGQKVTIGSVHERIWKNQREFQLEVVAGALREPVDPGSNHAFEQAVQTIRKFTITTLAERRYAIQTAIRMSSQHLTEQPLARSVDIAHRVRFQLWALGADHPDAAGLAEAITDIRTATTKAYANTVRSIMAEFGLRVREDAGDPDEAIEAVALLGNAVNIGLRTDILPQATKIRMLPTGPSGEPEEWYPDAVALWSFTRSMFEIDDDSLSESDRRL